MNVSNKNFGVTISFFLFFLTGYYYLVYDSINYYSTILGLFFLILGLFNSKILTPFNWIWMWLGYNLGRFISPIIISLIYFAIVFPTSIILKILKKDILGLEINKKTKTYWQKRINQPGSMNDQF